MIRSTTDAAPAPSGAGAGLALQRSSLRMALLPLAAVLLLGLLIWLSSSGLDSVVAETRQIVGRNLDGTVRISEIAINLQTINTKLYRLMTLQAAGLPWGDVAGNLAVLAEEISYLRADLAAYRDGFATPEQARTIDGMLEQLQRYQDAVQWVGSMLQIDFTSAVAFIQPFNAIFDHLAHQFNETAAAVLADAHSRSAQAAASAERTVQWFAAVTLAAAIGVAVFAWSVGRYQQRLRVETEQLEALVAERTRELEQRSADLEDSLVRLREAQDQLVMKEKMASLGGLVAGVAHEINTPIGTALTAASFLGDEMATLKELVDSGRLRRADLQRYFEDAGETGRLLLANINRAAELVMSFKQVAVDQTSAERRRFQLKGYLEEVLLSLQPRLKGKRLQVTVTCPDLIELDSYPGAISQIITNFILNSLGHAYDDGAAGMVMIEVAAPSPSRIDLTYADDGKGIPAAVLPKIFDPFFTTRRGAGGTGLGLHIVYNLVTRTLHGAIEVRSEPGRGTRFTLHLPRVTPADGAPQGTA